MTKPYIGHGFEEKHWKKITKELVPDEHILGIFNYGKKHYIIITSLNFINWKRGIYIERPVYSGGPYTRIPWGLVRMPKLSENYPNAIEITINSKVVTFKEINPDDSSKCIDMVKREISGTSNLHIGKNVSHKQYTQAMDNFIDSDEDILGIFRVAFRQGKELKEFYLYVTNKKIARWTKESMSKDLILYDYNTIIRVEAKKGLPTGDLRLHFSGHQDGYFNMGKTEGILAAEIIKEQIAKIKTNQTSVNQAGVVRGSINDDPIKIIQARYAKGEITKKVFEQMLNDLQKSDPKKVLFCKACGSENNSESGFCMNCGIALE